MGLGAILSSGPPSDFAFQLAIKWYQLYLKRDDPPGVLHWATEIKNDGPVKAWQNFSNSPEPLQKGVAQLAQQYAAEYGDQYHLGPEVIPVYIPPPQPGAPPPATFGPPIATPPSTGVPWAPPTSGVGPPPPTTPQPGHIPSPQQPTAPRVPAPAFAGMSTGTLGLLAAGVGLALFAIPRKRR